MKQTAIILSGGKGSRMQRSIPKQYLLLAGKPMIMHSLDRLDKLDCIDEIIIVCDESYNSMLTQMIRDYNVQTKVNFVKAGQTRQESVYNGLMASNTSSVLIHEAARPFVKTAEFQQLINDEEENITFGYDIPYTVLKGTDVVTEILNRSELFNVQLPQKFNKDLLLSAHEAAINKGNTYTEDASLLFNELKRPIKIIRGKSYNLKITEPIDLLFGEIIYKTYISIRK